MIPAAAVELDRKLVREIESTAGARAPKAIELLTEASAAFDEGDFGRAVEAGEACKRVASRSASVRELLGLSLYASGEWKRALSELRTQARLTGSPNQYPVMADCLRATGRPEKALEYLDEMADVDVPEPVRIEGELVRAGILTDMDDIPGAVRALRSVLREPQNVELHHLRLWYMLADLFERAGREAEAGRLFGRIAEHDPDFLDAAHRAG